MRILIIHNYYQDAGGEDAVFQQEAAILGLTEKVETLTFKNHKGIKGFFQFAAYPWNIAASIRIRKAIKAFRPDVVHIHNLHYAIGPLAIRMIHRLGIPIFFTLHNYRLLCPSAILFHQGKIFQDSLNQGFPWKAVKLGVYSHSTLKTYWLAFTNYIHHKLKTWNMVNQYLVLTDFAKDLYQRSDYDCFKGKILVKPNFLAEKNEHHSHPNNQRSTEFLFVGRLSEEKGILLLLSIFSKNQQVLRIAGDGPLKEKVIATSQHYPNIIYLGALNKQQIRNEMKNSTALIFPSLWFEGMPMTLIEAFSCGTPVIASNLGAMQSMIEDQVHGLLFEPGNERDLSQKIEYWINFPVGKKHQIQENNFALFNEYYLAEENIKSLLEYYEASKFV